MNALLVVLAVASRVLFSFTDPAITESSGLVDLGSLMVTTNDSGDDAVLYVIDPRTGRTVGKTFYARSAVDVEALAPAGKDAVWAGDIGDNTETRPFIEVHRVPIGRGVRHVDVPSYRLVYPDGPHDAESLIAPGGRLYVITKGVLGGKIYVAPRPLDPNNVNRLKAVGVVTEWATDAAMLGSKHILVRGYGSAEVLTYPGYQKVAGFDLPGQQQGEGISVGPGHRVRLSSEGVHSPVLQIALPARVTDLLEPPKALPPRPETPVLAKDDGTSPAGPWAYGAGALVLAGVALWWTRRRAR
ncbi:hypothetical protein [Nocardioides marmorisolisilvae]|uniref:WD40 repeat domain-containing protein n=1 Tax=Nocardioides marmorisolisilvae TaxID=1542737 RepID=A0A3N0DNT2_9ACTN|nr:hypothetical protein [Nocardioides marmorisolisilvae]RNL77315.1 hypothetical protein EFL95_17825 [Nocardioides marmorisolisilvae]